MKKYLIACDIDGTLINDQKELEQVTIETLRKVRDLGHTVIIATGRPLAGALHIYNQLGIEFPIITDNGASIDFPGHIEFAKQRTYIPLPVMKTLFAYSKEYLVSAFFSDEEKVYAYKYNEDLEKFFVGLTRNNLIECDFNDLDVEPNGLIFLVKPEHKDKIEKWIDFQYPDILSFRIWGTDKEGNIMYEIYLKHVSKASAIKYVLDYYSIDPKNTIAFGDGVNDVEMISQMTFGIAMKNCVPELKDVCYQMTEYDNNEQGLAKYLNKFFNLY